jgi:hypothetical protein
MAIGTTIESYLLFEYENDNHSFIHYGTLGNRL